MQNPNAFRHGRTICAYCGTSPAPEKEHVVARAFFSKPIPNDLIVVASCYNCNHGFKSSLNRDEDYVRSLFITGEYAILHPSAAYLLNGPFERACDTNQGEPPGILRAARQTEIITNSGTLDGYNLELPIDFARISRVAEKIVRGLHYHETGKVVPANSQVDVTLFLENGGAPKLDNFMILTELISSIPGYLHIVATEFGDHVFTYWAALHPHEPSGAWLMGFYNGAFPVGVVVHPIAH